MKASAEVCRGGSVRKLLVQEAKAFGVGCQVLREVAFHREASQQEQVIDGLDRAVKNMKKGEIALVIIQPEYAFGPSGSPQELATVPFNSTVYYEVELVSFIKVFSRGCDETCCLKSTSLVTKLSRNVKALYRRAQAYIQLVDLDLAEMDIKKALEI